MKNGEVDEVKWLEIDGLKGVQFREANPEKPDDIRRLQWMAYRKYAGQVQMVNLMLSSNGKGFPKHQDAMYGDDVFNEDCPLRPQRAKSKEQGARGKGQ